MSSLDGRAKAVRLAVVDSDTGFLHVLTKRMDAAGWEYRISGGPLPVEALVRMRLSALVVNLGLLGPQAWSYLESVCRELPGLAVVVCTGQSSVGQRVRGLRMGADDWITKPCHPEELIARVEAVRRRRRSAPSGEEAKRVAGELEIRTDQFQAFVGGRSIELTRREFELLELLAGAQAQVMQREDIYQRVWGYAMAHGDRSVDVFVRKLRQKLETASPEYVYIHTHFGVGYRFAPEPREPQAEAPAPAPAEAVSEEPTPVAS